MFKSSLELKEFIIWCKSQKVKSFKNSDIQFDLSDLAFIDETLSNPKLPELGEFDSKTLVDTDEESSKEDEEMLFWSSN